MVGFGAPRHIISFQPKLSGRVLGFCSWSTAAAGELGATVPPFATQWRSDHLAEFLLRLLSLLVQLLGAL